MKKAITIVVVFFFCCYSNAQSITPSVFNAAGASFKQGYYQFEWSVGELSLIGEMTSSNNSFVITNGFIQPFIQYPAKDDYHTIFATDEIKVFPNPASSYVEINLLTKQKGRITLSFYDGGGKKIYTATDWYYGVGMIKRIPVTKLPNEVYMLHVDLDPDPGSIAKNGVYKIIKIK